MASMRRFGNALSDTGSILLHHLLQLRQQNEQSELVRQRQQELAEQQNAFRAGQAEDARRQKSLEQVLGDPTGLVAQRLSQAGEQWARDYVPSGHQAASKIGAKIGSMKREELPTDVGLEESLRSAPGGEDYSKDPRAVKYLIDQKGARMGQLAQNAATEATEAGAKSDAMGYGQQTGTNRAKNENAPIETANKVAEEKALSPVLVNRAAGVATAQQSALTKGEGDRIRQAYELAAQDPAIAASAAAAIQDPTVLDKIDAKSRKYVIDAMNSEKFQGAAKQQAVKMLTEAKDALEKMLDPSGGLAAGGAGAAGAKGPSSLFGAMSTPFAGTAAAGWVAYYDKFKAAMTLPNIRYMQGLGHMSDVEFGTIAKASTAANRDMPEAVLKKELLSAYNEIIKGLRANGVDVAAAINPVSPLQSKVQQLRGR
jgi:hypothetical protein